MTLFDRHSLRRTVLGALTVLAVTGSAGLAAAQNAPAAQPNIHVDLYGTNVWLWTDTHPPVSHYRFTVSTVLFGENMGGHSMLRVDWKQGGRTLASQSCPLSIEGNRAEVECQLAQPTLDASGPVSADLRYIDDNTGADVLLHTLNLRVGRFWNWTGMERNRPVHVAVYQIIPNDLLGSSILRLRAPNDANVSYFGNVVFMFYTAQERPGWPAGQATFQCSVDGQRITTDLTGGSDWIDTASGGDNIVVDDRRYDTRAHDATTVHYAWTQIRVFPNLRYRARGWRPNAPTNGIVDITTHPGHWACQLRTNGQMVREFRFTVTPTGGIEPHPEQAAANGVFLAPGSYLVETRFPNPNTFDRIFDPAAIRAGGFFGHAWTQPAAFQEMFAALPPAVGQSEPPAPPGAPRANTAPAAAAGAGGRGGGRRH